MTKLLALIISLLALSLTAAACGEDEDEGPSEGGGAAQTQEQPPPATQPSSGGGGGSSVSMKDIAFNPEEISVKQGATVTWTNDESVGHDVTANDNSFKSGEPGAMQEGDTFKHKFAKTGEFAYACTVHPNMTGTVKVTP